MSPSAEHSDRALLERLLRTISPGDSVDVTINMLQHVTLPAKSADEWAPEHMIEWFRSRMAFDCTVTPDRPEQPSRWTFHRPPSQRSTEPASGNSASA
jgi:hypothetical protein